MGLGVVTYATLAVRGRASCFVSSFVRESSCDFVVSDPHRIKLNHTHPNSHEQSRTRNRKLEAEMRGSQNKNADLIAQIDVLDS
jgi:hypothetical protein